MTTPGTLPSENVLEMLAALNVNPFREMALLAMHDETPISTRAALWMALAKYCKPQLQAVAVASSQTELNLQPPIDRLRQGLGLRD